MQGGDIRFPFEEEELEDQTVEEEEEYYPREYGLDFKTGKLNGKIVEGSQALAVWAYLALQIGRYKYYTYSWDYGCELEDLIGGNYSKEYLYTEVNRMILECLEENPYIKGIENLIIEQNESTLGITFTILTDYGEEDVEISV